MNSTQSPLVTIIVPVRNGARTLQSALATVAAQTYPKLEIVLSDNASTDETPEIMRAFAASRSDATYVRHETALPVLEHFSTMIARARGKYVLLCAADDRRNEVFVEALVETLEATPDAVLGFGSLCDFRDDGVERRRSFPFDNERLPKALRLVKTSRLQCYHFYALWRTAVLQRIRIRECTYWPDMQVMMAANCMGTFARNDRAIFYYYETPKSHTQRARDQSFGVIHRHPRIQMIRTAIDGILEAGGGLPLAGIGGAALGLRELRISLAEARLRLRQRRNQTKAVP